MVRPKMLPTPASSTEIKGQDHSSKLASLRLTFELPPSALPPDGSSKPTHVTKPSPVSPVSPIQVPYLQASETVKSRRRAAAGQTKDFMLPPPPTRSCKIIQMKPRTQDKEKAPSSSLPSSSLPSSSVPSSSTTKGTGGKNGASKVKKQQPSATSAAGRKIARKTAHSLIERRRRSKMNDEFAVLKGLIPDCDGDMHKLAILQAAINYVRYLKGCKQALESLTNNHSNSTSSEMDYEHTSWQYHSEAGGGPQKDEEEELSPKQDAENLKQAQQPPISPALTADLHHSSFPSSRTSPPPPHPYPPAEMLSRPQLEIDQEASAALLLLHSWQEAGGRRASGPSSGAARGISVADLLSP